MFTRDQVAQACRMYGPRLTLPAEINGVRLLWALAGCESSFGSNTKPRHEQHYHDLAASGKNAELVRLTRQYGCDAHSSFGPWQELLVNCWRTMRPEDFADIDKCAVVTVAFINTRILTLEHATTVKQIAEAYNSGKWQWHEVPPGAVHYASDCERYYAFMPMPE